MKIEYWIIWIGIISAFVIGGINNIIYEEPKSYFTVYNFTTPSVLGVSPLSPINNSNFTITINCNYVDIQISFDNETIEFCEWFKQNVEKN